MKTIEGRIALYTGNPERFNPRAGEPKSDEGAPLEAYFDAMAEARERVKTDPEFKAAIAEFNKDAVLDLG